MFAIPPVADRVQTTLGYIEAAKDTNVHFILLLSSMTAEKEGLLMGDQYRIMEEGLKNSGIPYCIIRCTQFMENHFADAESIKKTETFSHPVSPDARFNPISIDDISKVAATILAAHSQHKGKTYFLCGPRPISMTYVTQQHDKIFKREVKFIQCDEESAMKIYEERGYPDWMARGYIQMWNMINEGKFRTSSHDAANIMGEQPMSFHQFLENNKLSFI